MIVKDDGLPVVPPLDRIGRRSVGVSRWASFSQTLENPDSIPVDTYERMVETDETVSTALEFITLSAFQYLGEYEHSRKRVEKFGRRVLEEMLDPWSHYFEEACGVGLWAGNSVTEPVLTERNGYVVPFDLPTLPPATYKFHFAKDGFYKGYTDGIVQDQGGGVKKFIGGEYLLHWAHRKPRGNPYGLSRLRAAWKHWYPKDVIHAVWPRTLERYAAPIAVAKSRNLATPVEYNGEDMERGEYLMRMLSSLGERSAVAIDADQDDVTFLQVSRAFGGDFEAFENHSNKMIFRALLMPALLFDAGDVGSYAMAAKQFQFFAQAMRGLAMQLGRLFVRQLMYRLIVLNFGEQSDGDYGQFRSQVLEEEEMKMWADIFFSMIQGRTLRPEQKADFEWMREKVGAPRGVEPAPPEAPAPAGGGGGKDGLPGQAPDGLDGAGPGTPAPAPKTPTKKQGRPQG